MRHMLAGTVLVASMAHGAWDARRFEGLPPDGAHPGVRNGHAMAYDAERRRAVMFGGADAAAVRGDTWAWRGPSIGWTPLAGDGPSPRTFPAMAYDGRRRVVLLFGGNRVLFGDDDSARTFLSDTWLLDGARWRLVRGPGPGPRAEAAVAYDAARGRVVLFGGYRRVASGVERLGDTWEWDGARWRQLAATGPAPRNGASLAYDERTRRVVLVGGPPRLVTPEVWSWDGARWRVDPGPPPPPRFNAVMAYHTGLKALLRFGGWTGEHRAADTWVRLPSGWRDLALSGPAPRNHAAIAHDRLRGRTVLFGGHDGARVFGDTWEFDGHAWVLAEDRPAEPRADNRH